MKQIKDKSVNMILCDLPYGTTRCKWDSIISLDSLWKQYERVIKDNGIIVLTSSQPFTSALITSNLKLFRYDLIWDKIKGTGFLNARKMPMRNHEVICVFYKKLGLYNPQKTSGHKKKVSFRSNKLQTEVYGHMKEDYKYESTERFPRSILKISTDTQNTSLHPTQKPLELGRYLVRTYTNEGDLVLDNACGSGTFPLSAKLENRNFIGIELKEKYYEIAKNRVKEVQTILTQKNGSLSGEKK